jgi:hypothetical protein
MQNPFIQLRKYPEGLSNPKENRATETLAACLVFSLEVRREFLNFLFDGERRFENKDMLDYAVSTQQQTADGDWVDLLIEKEGEESIVVEVKVEDGEDGEQIESYVKWLKSTKKGTHQYVFHLVKKHNPAFNITVYGGKKHHIWEELYGYFKKQYFEPTDASLIEHFCNYLEVEGIVSTWNPKDILPYGPGLVANRALRNLFEQVEKRLDESQEADWRYTTKIVMRDEEWPRLEIGRTSWKSIFGEKGYLNKVYAFYAIKDVWESTANEFRFEIHLWDRRCDWDLTEPKLPKWLEKLRQERFVLEARLKGSKSLEADIDGHKFSEPPERIAASSSNVAIEKISTNQIETLSSEALVEEVYRRVLKHCDIVSQLR